MIGRVLVLTNSQEIEDAQAYVDKYGTGVEIPAPVYDNKMMLFNMKDVQLAYITPYNHIRIRINDDEYDMIFDEVLWLKLMQKFNDGSDNNS